MPPLFASFFDSLDGVTYFFVSSGIFVLVPAVIYFGLGLWIGALTWGRYKRRFFAGQETIEDMKNELALLKRRSADLAARALTHQPGAARTAMRSPLAALVPFAINPLPALPMPSAAFTVWTEAGWIPQPVTSSPLPASAAFSLWCPPKTMVGAAHDIETTTSGAGKPMHFTLEHTPKVKRR